MHSFNLSIKFENTLNIIRNNFPTTGVGGWGVKKTLDPSPHPPTTEVGGWWGGGTHVALFMHTVFHINRFQLGYYMSVPYKRADIIMC